MEYKRILIMIMKTRIVLVILIKIPILVIITIKIIINTLSCIHATPKFHILMKC